MLTPRRKRLDSNAQTQSGPVISTTPVEHHFQLLSSRCFCSEPPRLVADELGETAQARRRGIGSGGAVGCRGFLVVAFMVFIVVKLFDFVPRELSAPIAMEKPRIPYHQRVCRRENLFDIRQ